MGFISSDLANKYYENILAIHRMNNDPCNKVPSLKNELEDMLALPELAGVNNQTDGQHKWLNKNIKTFKNNNGFIPPVIVSGLKAIFYAYRNQGEHGKDVFYGEYLGNFSIMARAISFFSNTPIPPEIKAVCDGEDDAEAKKRESELLAQLEESRKREAELLAKVGEAINEEQPLPAQEAAQHYRIGDCGPAGGLVFYDKGDNSDGWRYLEAAPKDLGNAAWGLDNYDLKETSTEIGLGKWNTELIIEELYWRRESGKAAQLCKEYTLNGYNDWFLPSNDELTLLYVNLKANENLRKNHSFFDDMKKINFEWFSGHRYWSSSQNDNIFAWDQRFSDGVQYFRNLKSGTVSFRAVRAF